jgi:DNA-binding NarL/FixJ family response regulator
MSLRVVVAEDHALMRVGLVAVLQGQGGMEVVAEAETGPAAVEAYRRHLPDVMLVDLLMPGLDGVGITEAVRGEWPAARVVLLTASGGNEDIYRALRAGAQAYLLKSVSPTELVRAIRDVCAGRRVIPPDVAAQLAERMPLSDLTPRELEVLGLIVDGCANKEIAARLGLGETTVKTHVANVLGKLDVEDRTQAATAALTRGIVRRR